jgi:hypothetical protein
MASASGREEKRARRLVGRKKKRAVRTAVRMPTREPKVPGAVGTKPTPSAVASAKGREKRGLAAGTGLDISVFGVMGTGQIQNDGLALAVAPFVFVKDGLGDDVLLRGPVAEVEQAATLAAKGEAGVF